jgi:hypothetical protein
MAGVECPEENGDEEEEDSMGIFVISRFGPRWHEWATSAKRIYLNVVSNKSDKYVGAILRVVFECLPSVIMAKM